MRNCTETPVSTTWSSGNFLSEYTAISQIINEFIRRESFVLKGYSMIIQAVSCLNLFYGFKHLFLRYQRKYTQIG